MKSDQVRPIESSSNPQFKLWKACTEPRGIKKHQKALLSGKKLVEEFLEFQADHALALIGTEGIESGPVPTYCLSPKLFKELDILGTGSPLLFVKTPTLKQWEISPTPQGKEIFLALQDPGNLGAALRLAEAFHMDKVILLKECAHPLHPKCLKASSGSALRLQLEIGPSIQDLSHLDIPFIGLDKSGVGVEEFQWPSHFRLVLGEEGRGLPPGLKTQSLQIPINDKLESLNATSALAIALYSQKLFDKRK